MSNFYFLCITQPSNLGDLIINKMLVDELCRYGKVYVDAYKTPEAFRKELVANQAAIDLYKEKRITAKRLDFIRLYKLVQKEKIRFYVSSPGPIEGGNRLYSFVLRLIKLTFRLAGAKAYCIGGCASSMISSGKVFKSNGVEHYYMRSQKSVDYINSYYQEKASYIPDLAYLLTFKKEQETNTIEKRAKAILVNFREPKEKPAKFFEWCKQIIGSFVRQGYQVTLYYQVQGDREYVLRLYKETQSLGVSLIDRLVWYEDLQIYEDKSAVVSNRLHSLLVGAAYGAIPVACVSDSKLVSKIQDVLTSSFNELAEQITFPYYSDINNMVKAVNLVDRSAICSKVIESATLCRKVINNLVSNCEQ